jgi:hypothetical protein
MIFRTEIEIPRSDFRIHHRQQHLLLGSCFAENIGNKLIDNKFKVDLNPFGIVYNPSSAAKILGMLWDRYDFSESDILFDKGLYMSLMHHSQFSHHDKAFFLDNLRQSALRSAKKLQQADNLMVTFGTAYVYSYKQSGGIVNNCHKLPASLFERRRLSVAQIVDEWSLLIQRFTNFRPGIRFLFTVSPIRHWKDGAHENQLSKSILLLAIEELQTLFPRNVHYFPSYELILDDLRDYRFYAEDMIHPNTMAIDYCWEKFDQTYFDEETRLISAQWRALSKALTHRPFRIDSDQHQHFLRETLAKMEHFASSYPFLNCQKEIDQLKTSIIGK